MSCPTAATATPTPVMSVSKREFARRHSSSERTVDNWIAAGLPVLRYSTRKLLIPLALADAWLQERFLVCRRTPSTAHLRVVNPSVRSAPAGV